MRANLIGLWCTYQGGARAREIEYPRCISSSSHDDSTDEHESTRTQKPEPDAVQVAHDGPAALAKLDSNVKVEVKDEDLYAYYRSPPQAQAPLLDATRNARCPTTPAFEP